MEKKQILIYSGILVIGIGAMIVTILFLRSRSAPIPDSGLAVTMPTARPIVTGTAGKTSTSTSAKIRPYTKIEDVPFKQAWKKGDPPIPIPIEPTAEQMDNGIFEITNQ
ncbi:hypothetical protein HZC53_03965 [Candidatus Uhrbacteria bacterium]|nr:hypothetical protein [Candidatus Uhrbacteria bacterium]